jgi:hypothetical protein
MAALVIEQNGTLRAAATCSEFEGLAAEVSGGEDTPIWLSFRGHRTISAEQMEHLDWLRERLRPGDLITMSLVESAVPTAPRERHLSRLDPQSISEDLAAAARELARIPRPPKQSPKSPSGRLTFLVSTPRVSGLKVSTTSELNLNLAAEYSADGESLCFELISFNVRDDGSIADRRTWLREELHVGEYVRVQCAT